jgi:hypothetical protein
MSSANPIPAQAGDDLAEAMTAYGIRREPVDYFHWNGFRYSTLKDAVAAARRAERMGGGNA